MFACWNLRSLVFLVSLGVVYSAHAQISRPPLPICAPRESIRRDIANTWWECYNSDGPLGLCVGETTDWCGTVDLGAATVDLSDSPVTRLPVSTSISPSATSSAVMVRSDMGHAVLVGRGDGQSNVLAPSLPFIPGADEGAFTYAGQGTGECSEDICRGGVCSGTAPNGTCTITANAKVTLSQSSYTILAILSPATNIYTAVVRTYKSFALTAGTVKVDVSSMGWARAGVPLLLAVRGDASLSGGTIDLRGIGGESCFRTTMALAASTAGVIGERNTLYLGGAAGAATPTAGGAGINASGTAGAFDPWPITVPVFFMGTGGGVQSCDTDYAGTQVATRASLRELSDGPVRSATGGGSGGCTTGASGNGGPGGDGGGYLQLYVGGTFTCSGTALIDVRGEDGTLSAGGGGGGGVVVRANKVTNSCTTDTTTCSGTGKICVKGGAGGTAATNCSAGGAGGIGGVSIAAW